MKEKEPKKGRVRDITVALASTLVIQASLVGYWGVEAGLFDAHATEATLRELKIPRLSVDEDKYKFGYDRALQKDESDMYVIQGEGKATLLAKQKKRTDAVDGLFDRDMAERIRLAEENAARAEKERLARMKEGACDKRFIIHHFKKGSSRLGRMVIDQLRELLPQVSKASDVKVEGFTCSKGGQKLNDRLAIDRAKNVAAYLRKEGVVVSEVKGKGRDHYISAEKKLNRRVEIQTKP